MPKTNAKVELFYSGSWHDITLTDDVYTRDSIKITRGRADESQRVSPSTLNLTLDNRDGRYSPRNPTSPLYGLIGRNTPIRVSVDGSYRFWGEVESWPQRSSVDGNDAWTPITANGILRRLNAPGTTKPALSALRRAVLTSATQPWVYWPMETETDNDTAANQTLLSPVVGVPAMVQTVAGAAFGKGLAGPGVAGVPDFRTGGTLEALVPDDGLFAAATGYTVEFVARYDKNPGFSGGPALRWYTPGSAGPTFWEFSPGPNMDLFFGTESVFQGSASGGVTTYDSLSHHYRVTVVQSGGNITINLYRDGVLVDVGDDFGGGDPVVTGTVNRPTRVVVSAGNAGNPTDEAPSGLGHVTIWHGTSPAADTPAAATAHAGETAAERIERLCTEEDIAITIVGDPDASELVGVQRVAPFLDLVFDAADADGGILYEPRDSLGLAYRVHADLYNQDPALTLNYAVGAEVAPDLEPVEDTDATGNDITVTRFEGDRARVVKETGTLNVQEPPTGAGRYRKDFTLVLYADSQCLNQAAWQRHLGTWDEARYPVVNVDLTAMVVAGKTTLKTSAIALDIGGRFAITNAPNTFDSIVQLAQGFREDIGSHTWTIAINATPALPYEVLELETDATNNLSRIPAATGATTLDEAATTAQTRLVITSTTVRWIDSINYAAQFPFDIAVAGERIRITASANYLNANPFFESSASPWTAQNGATAVRSTAQFHEGAASLLITPDGVSFAPQATSEEVAAVAGRTYTVSGWIRSTGAATRKLGIFWYDASHSLLSSNEISIALSAGVWTQFGPTGFVAPANTAFLRIFTNDPGAPAAGNTWFLDEAMVTSGTLQVFTGTRSINGVVKAQTAGTAVQLFRPPVIAR